jgi:hypothetical protein
MDNRVQMVGPGERFHNLVVIKEGPKDPKRQERRYYCRCDCGTTTLVQSGRLRSGNTKSCGCRRITHGHTRGNKNGTRTYHSWRSMQDRCLNSNSDAYANYGGRGITICDRWLGPDGLANFLADLGERPQGLTLDRIDNEGNYEPGNCQWATWNEQAAKRRRSGRLPHAH